ncbi:MAG: YfiR family protein [Dissulfurispiraceae bacterium]
MKSECSIPFSLLLGAGHFIAGLALCLSFLAVPVVSYSESEQAEEYEVKAAFLFNFARLTEWPGDAFRLHDKNFEICLVGDDRFGGILDTLSSRAIGGRSVSIRRITDFRESSACNLLFISSSEAYRLRDIISFVKERPILTVSNIKGFEKEGGIIAFYLMDNRVRFRINIDAARKARLKISSYLLEVAGIARDGGK